MEYSSSSKKPSTATLKKEDVVLLAATGHQYPVLSALILGQVLLTTATAVDHAPTIYNMVEVHHACMKTNMLNTRQEGDYSINANLQFLLKLSWCSTFTLYNA
jgi:hypothetical protein